MSPVKKPFIGYDKVVLTYAELKERPEARNLVDIYAALSGVTTDAVMAEHGGAGWGRFKPRLAEIAVEAMEPITSEMNRLMGDPTEIDRVLGEGANKAREIAAPILAQTYEVVGLISSR